MDTIWIIILGAIQGATEFLPVSSSGHLAAGQMLMPQSPSAAALNSQPLMLEILLHLATLVSVILIYRKEVLNVLKGIVKGLQSVKTGQFRATLRQDSDVQLAFALAVAMVPSGVLGPLMFEPASLISKSATGLGCCFLGCACLLFASRFWPGGDRPLTWRTAVIISAVQAVAVLPGISRSGATIATGLALGLNREDAARFSFLLSIPTILAAAILKIDFAALAQDQRVGTYAIGAAVAFGIGLGALVLLLKLVRKGRLWLFAPYLAILGGFSILFL